MGEMDSLNRIFWARQETFLFKIFLPVIIGFLVLLIGLAGLFVLSFWWRHYRLWRLGKDEDRFDQVSRRVRDTLAVVFGNFRIGRELFPGTFHLLIFWGAVLIFLGKFVRLFSYFGLANPPQAVFCYASFISEIGGLMAIVGGCMAAYRRYILKPERLETKPDNSLVFIWGAFLIVTGYLIKGYRIATVGVHVPPDWLTWAPLSYLFSRLMLILPSAALNELLIWHRVLIHAIPGLILVAFVIVTRTPMQHWFLSPLNVYLRSFKTRGTLEPIPNFDEAETYGAKEISELTWKQLLDLEACTNCGRCQDACPAHLTGKPLSPRRMTQNLKDHLRRQGPVLLATPKEKREPEPIMEKTVGEDELWACTTCMACEEACPVYVEQIKRNVEIRRYLTLVETKFTSDIKLAFKNLQNNGNPWGLPRNTRIEWIKNLGIKKYAEETDPEILFWVGCAGSFDARNQKVSATLVKILQASGIRFGILGTSEGCCGDSARRMGNEYLFITLAEANIETMKGLAVKKILTFCPHCFHTLKHEYPQFGGQFEVIHYTQFLGDLLSQGRLKLTKPIDKVITYHDSCYLGRGNELYDLPRRINQSIPGLRLVEMERHRDRSFCCGAGGGRMWMEEHIGTRINQARTDQAIQTGAALVGTACPYCLTMLADGIKEKGKEESMAAFDLIELVSQSME
jgi:Fe-S oxidoreductase/nitrate reductase gamma subunit